MNRMVKGFWGLMGGFVGGLILTSNLHAEVVIACEHPQQSGLYKQCQEVTVLQTLGDRVRVFGKADKKVSLVDNHRLFLAKVFTPSSHIQAPFLISAPGSLLWNNSPKGYQSLCEVKSKTKNLLDISCGRRQNETISHENAYLISPYFSTGIRPTALIQKSTP